MITLTKLRRFVATRNKSGFASNLQFQIDAEACGFRLGDLGDAKKFQLDGFTGYQWDVQTKDGIVTMIEFGRGMHLSADEDSKAMFNLMERSKDKVVWCEPCQPSSN